MQKFGQALRNVFDAAVGNHKNYKREYEGIRMNEVAIPFFMLSGFAGGYTINDKPIAALFCAVMALAIPLLSARLANDVSAVRHDRKAKAQSPTPNTP